MKDGHLEKTAKSVREDEVIPQGMKNRLEKIENEKFKIRQKTQEIV